MQVSDADLKNLGEARAQSVRQYLSTKVDPARLSTAAPKLDASGIDDKGKTTRADLSLQ
jgi:outer membrane protein OmpA-like peptidoglycan-associated protein